MIEVVECIQCEDCNQFHCNCKSGEALYILFKQIPEKNYYGYWLITELFTLLHGGKDYCSGKIEQII